MGTPPFIDPVGSSGRRPTDKIALAVVHFLNGEFEEAERLRSEWMAGRS
jgi:hypothetical protein